MRKHANIIATTFIMVDGDLYWGSKSYMSAAAQDWQM